jgi:hypothetical protein
LRGATRPELVVRSRRSRQGRGRSSGPLAKRARFGFIDPQSAFSRGLKVPRDDGSEIERKDLRRQFRNFVILVAVLLALMLLALQTIQYWRS